MPEGPEVTRVAVQLDSVARNTFMEDVVFNSGRYSRQAPEGYKKFTEALDKGALLVKAVHNKGKFIWWELEHNWYIFSTLGMSGSYKLQKTAHSHIHFDMTRAFNKYTENFNIFYVDPRNFGTIKFVNDSRVLNKKLDEIGPDMLNNPCSLENFIKIARKRNNKSIVSFLLDQKAISGVGNIYKSESLYLSKISPLNKVKDITDKELETLYCSIIKVLKASYTNGGSTISTYTDLYNIKGSNTSESRLMVYSQKLDPQGNKVERITLDDKRTTFFVPAIQI